MNEQQPATPAKPETKAAEKTAKVERLPWKVNADGTVSVRLKRPLDTHGGTVSEIVIREPLADVYFEVGPPYEVLSFSDDNDKVVKTQTALLSSAVRRYLVACTDHDEGVLAGMTAFDAVRCGNAIVAVFFNDAGN